jgi:dTDP-4-amino-4,6-dideoxygalactose transaminase
VIPAKTTALCPSRAEPSAFDAVPLLDLQRQYAAIREEVLAAIERVCSSQQFILGSEVNALEVAITSYTGAADAVGCASGTDALWLALVAAGVQPGDAVLSTPFSFFASASAIVRAGARPVFADVDPATLNLDPAEAETKIRSGGAYKLRAILPVHLYGQCADMDRIEGLAAQFDLAIVEDAAQAIGASWRERRAGSLGVTAAFSFYPTKNLSAYGEAGMVTTRDPAQAERMRQWRNHGSPLRYLHEDLGWNCRMDAIQAAVLRVKFRHIESWNQKRRERAANYHRLFQEAGLTSSPASSQDTCPIRPLTSLPRAHHVYHQYVVRAQQRDELRQFLAQRRIGSEVYYPLPLHLQPCFAYLGYRPGDLPESELAAKEVVALPMFPELTEAEQAWVVENIAQFYS